MHIALATAGVYLVFYLAFEPAIALEDFGRRGDFSYGLYLYGWPVQQLIAYHFLPNLSPAAEFALSLPLAIVCAAISWHWIERPWLRKKEPGRQTGAIPDQSMLDALASVPLAGDLSIPSLLLTMADSEDALAQATTASAPMQSSQAA